MSVRGTWPSYLTCLGTAPGLFSSSLIFSTLSCPQRIVQRGRFWPLLPPKPHFVDGIVCECCTYVHTLPFALSISPVFMRLRAL
jgi:hypothetical protein